MIMALYSHISLKLVSLGVIIIFKTIFFKGLNLEKGEYQGNIQIQRTIVLCGLKLMYHKYSTSAVWYLVTLVALFRFGLKSLNMY